MTSNHCCIGILAHVDSGKTTLSEALLFAAGQLKKRGRVDHGDSFLDTDTIERRRGITIFSKQAEFTVGRTDFSLLDTPGHVDFQAETERTLCVLDCAVLVISGPDGVQSHTRTLWQLLRRYGVPTFIFVNKTDLNWEGKEAVLAELSEKLGDGFADFSVAPEKIDYEQLALFDDVLLDEYVQFGKISRESLADSIRREKIFPCYFGSALKYTGVEELLRGLARYALETEYPDEFSARVYKISQDEKGKRLTHIKLTGGSLKLKDSIRIGGSEQKINEIRIYSGVKYRNVQEVSAGDICALCGLAETSSGQGLGAAPDDAGLFSEAVFSYTVVLPPSADMTEALRIFRTLEEEDGALHVDYSSRTGKISVRLMGKVQLEVLKTVLLERFGLDAGFESGSIVYLETIANTVEGMGHYEPLRHYAEVHLLMEPGARGSGITIGSALSTDVLDLNWQRLILNHLREKTHLGVLTGSPLTDVRITLVGGRAHIKHTEGGDFRQATYRAVRQGLMQAESVLLEPWFNFTLTLPSKYSGRAMTDISNMGGRLSEPQLLGDTTVLSGSVPAEGIKDYQGELSGYTRGLGVLALTYCGYRPCAEQDRIVSSFAYDPEADLENSPSSVFCSHGAGELVKWDKVRDHVHIQPLKLNRPEVEKGSMTRYSKGSGESSDEELLRIFEQTYGKIKGPLLFAPRGKKTVGSGPEKNGNGNGSTSAGAGKDKSAGCLASGGPDKGKSRGDLTATDTRANSTKNNPVDRKHHSDFAVSGIFPEDEEVYLFIDGYNMIFAWEELKALASEGLSFARLRLIDRISNYQAFREYKTYLVFDAYKVQGAVEKLDTMGELNIVYTREGETADRYIQRTVAGLPKGAHVIVASSDQLVQISVLGHGAMRVPAGEFLAEVEKTEARIRGFLR